MTQKLTFNFGPWKEADKIINLMKGMEEKKETVSHILFRTNNDFLMEENSDRTNF